MIKKMAILASIVLFQSQSFAGAFTDIKLTCQKEKTMMSFPKLTQTTVDIILNEREVRFFLDPIPNAYTYNQDTTYISGLFMGTARDGKLNYDANRMRSYAGMNISYVYISVEPQIFENKQGKITFTAVHTESSYASTQVDNVNFDCTLK